MGLQLDTSLASVQSPSANGTTSKRGQHIQNFTAIVASISNAVDAFAANTTKNSALQARCDILTESTKQMTQISDEVTAIALTSAQRTAALKLKYLNKTKPAG